MSIPPLEKIINSPDIHMCDPSALGVSEGLYKIASTTFADAYFSTHNKGGFNYISLTADGDIFYFENIQKIKGGYTCNILHRPSQSYVGLRNAQPVTEPFEGAIYIPMIESTKEFIWTIRPYEDGVQMECESRGTGRAFLFCQNYKGLSIVVVQTFEINTNNRESITRSLETAFPNRFSTPVLFVGNYICDSPPCSPIPNTNINYCKGDCVKGIIPLADGSYSCNYDMNKVTSNFLRQWAINGWDFPSWNVEQKRQLCSSIDNPFNVPNNICSDATDALDNYCASNINNFFSNECIEHIRNTVGETKEVKPLFKDKLFLWCHSRADQRPANSDVKRKFDNSCSCILTDTERAQTLKQLRDNYDGETYINTLFGKPTNCWLDRCQDVNNTVLVDYSGCGDVVFCIENIDIDASGNVSNVDVQQNEQCKAKLSKKRGGGGNDKPNKRSPILFWIILGIVVLISMGIIMGRILRKKNVD